MTIAPVSFVNKLSDAELLQYANQQKALGNMANFALAFQTSQDRARMRQDAAAQMMGGPKPTVVNQDLQQMAANAAPSMPSGIPLVGAGSVAQMPETQQQATKLPEEQGIGTLPANNLKGMAEGGITGYDSGGKVPRFQAGAFISATNPNAAFNTFLRSMGVSTEAFINSSSNVQQNLRDMFNSTLEGAGTATETAAAETAPAASGILGGFKNVLKTGSPLYTLAAMPLMTSKEEDATIANMIAKEKAAKNAAQNAQNAKVRPVMVNDPRLTTPNTFASERDANMAIVNASDNPTQDNETDTTQPKTTLSSGITAPVLRASGVATGPAPTAATAKQQANTFYNPNDIQQMYENDITETGVQNAQSAEALRKLMENRPVLGKKQEARIAAEEAKEPELREQNKNMALLEAGLAILGGTSPYGLQNLSLAKEGVKSYKEGLKDIQKAHDLRQQALDHIDDMRDAQKIGDQNLAYTEQQKAGDKMAAARHAATTGFASALGVSGQIGAHLFDNATNNYMANLRTNAEVGSRMALGNAQLQMEANKLNMGPPEMQMARMLGGPNGDIELGLAKLAQIQAGKLNPMKEYLDYKAKAVGKVDAYGQPVPIQSASEFFKDLERAQLSLAAMAGPGKPTNKAPSNLRE